MARKSTKPKAAKGPAGSKSAKARKALKKAKAGRAAKVKPPKAQAKADRKALHGDTPPWTKAEIEEAFRRFSVAMPEPMGELVHVNPFTLLVAVVRELIKTIGLFRMKAKNVIGLSERLIAEHGGQVPDTREALQTLPGVGRKTANVVLNIAFRQPTMAVDTHIFRIGNRTGLAPGKDPLAVELKLLEVVPEKYMLHAHHWLILHGRYICLARRPLCEKCIIADLCKWPGKTTLTAASATSSPSP
jgi:endonuclease-3